MSTITTVEANEELTLQPTGDRITVLPACDLQAGGHWYCVTHDEYFQNQLMKDSHISRGDHKMAWVCLDHGIETP